MTACDSPRPSPARLLSVLSLLLASSLTAGTPLPPRFLSTYFTEYTYVPAGPNPIDQLRVSAYCGNSALSTDGTVWYTRRADWKGDTSGGPDTPVVSLDVVYKGNLSEGTFAYWSEVPVEQAGRSKKRRASLSGSQSALGAPVCVAGALPLPGLWAGLLIDWIAGGEDVGVVFVGLENVTLPSGEVVADAEHWQQAAACRDIWLVPLPPAQGPWPPIVPYMQPRLMTWAAAASAPACDAANATVEYSNTTYLAPDDADQASALFTPPAQCFGGAVEGGGGGSGGAAGTSVPVAWLVGAVVASVVVGLGVGLLIGVRRQWRQLNRHAQDIHAAYTKSLMDSI